MVTKSSQEDLFAVEGEDNFERVHFNCEPSATINEIPLNLSSDITSIDPNEEIPDFEDFNEDNLILTDDPVTNKIAQHFLMRFRPW